MEIEPDEMAEEYTLGLRENNLFDQTLVLFATTIFALTVILATIQILVRNIPFISGLTWTEPVARVLLIVGTYIGSAVATRNREHIKIDLLLNFAKRNFRPLYILIMIINSLLIITFLSVAIYTIISAAQTHWSTAIGGGTAYISVGQVYLLIAFGLLLMLLFEIINIIVDLDSKGRLRGEIWSR